jgi:hypothetical protein
MKKTKCIKSIIGIGTIGAIGLGISAGITSCGKATDVVSFDSAYKPSVSTGDGEQTYHASSSMAGKISYKADNLPSEATFDNSSGKLNYTSAVPTNQDITINATSDKGGHSSIKITLLADTPVPPTPTPALSASILNNNLQLGTNNTATLSVTEINATE